MSLRAKFDAFRLKAASWAAGKRLSAHYAGASNSRLFYDWAVSILSPDSEAFSSLTIMRARARQLERDNPFIAGFLDELANNVVGPHGITLQARVTNSNGDPVKKTNWSIEAAWKEWSFPENASIDGIDSWTDIQRLHVRAIARDGESLIRRRAADNDFGFALQLIDPDLLDETLNRPAKDGQNEIRMGIERNADGKPLFYHLWKRHPSDLMFAGVGKEDHVRVPADEIIHDFVRTRPGQTRGVTWFAPILTTVKMLDGYTEAELIAARLQASQMGVITTTEEGAVAQYLAERARKANGGETTEPAPMEAAPGMMPRLMPGETMEMFNPTHPAMAFEPFTKTILRAIGRGLGIAYHTLTGDLREANYSSLRAGLLPERDHWRALQVWLAGRCHRRVFKWWVPAALASGQLQVDRRVPGELFAHVWKGRGWKWVDPLKDLQAAEIELRLGLSSRQRLHGEAGTNYEDTIDELKFEQEYAEAEGVDVTPEKKSDAAGSPREPDERPEARRLSVVGGA